MLLVAEGMLRGAEAVRIPAPGPLPPTHTPYYCLCTRPARAYAHVRPVRRLCAFLLQVRYRLRTLLCTRGPISYEHALQSRTYKAGYPLRTCTASQYQTSCTDVHVLGRADGEEQNPRIRVGVARGNAYSGARSVNTA